MTNDAIGLSYYTILARCFTQPHAGAVLIVLNEDHAGGLEGGDYPFASLGRRSAMVEPLRHRRTKGAANRYARPKAAAPHSYSTLPHGAAP